MSTSPFTINKTPKPIHSITTKNRKMAGLFPHPDSLEIFDALSQYESRSMHGQLPVVWDRASDYQIFDPYGNVWIDFTSTIFVANAGHAHPKIKKALIHMIEKDLLHTYNYPTKIRAQLLKYMVENTPKNFEKAYLMSSGTEATECLIKLIRMHGKYIQKTKPGIVSFQGAYHGRTIGAAQIGGNAQSQEWIGYQDPNIHQVPFPYEWGLNGVSGKDVFHRHLDELGEKGVHPERDISGFIFEAYIGWAASFIPKDYVQEAAKFCKENGVLLAFDEIQGGFGRTGKLFVYEHYDVEPDLIACGKGISSSMPLSAVLGTKAVMDLPDVGSMSSTHSANPLSCAAGLANLQIIFEEKLVDASEEKGDYLHKRLNAMKEKSNGYIRYVTGKGLLAALIFYDPVTQKPETYLPSCICEKAMESGLLLVHTGRESIKLAPPLSIPYDALKEGLDVLESVVLEQVKLQHAA
ncbi:MAG: aspartate aminotransferase family protein [Alphaproteobacteria bacterium]|nr:aspartate aminotransferase family protein [Alphaproteobacteria bacterium]